MSHKDAIGEIQDQVSTAYKTGKKLQILGGGSKKFYGNDLNLDGLKVSGLEGIVQYDPGELVIQLGAGTRLLDVIAILDKENQMLAFESPVFNGEATIGGMVASGISGSRRPYTGAVRDYLLGVDIIDGQGKHLSFGGQVMKNVAGYDVSRLLVGSMGCLGIMTELSFKVLPKPESELTRVVEVSRTDALEMMSKLQGHYPSISASAYFDDCLYVRFSGMENSVITAAKMFREKFGGEQGNNNIWPKGDNLELFSEHHTLWRLSIATDSRLFLDDTALIDWGGGQRWLVDPDFNPREVLSASGESGHLTLVRKTDNSRNNNNNPRSPFHPLNKNLLKLHIGLKKQFDPGAILNHQKMYEQF